MVVVKTILCYTLPPPQFLRLWILTRCSSCSMTTERAPRKKKFHLRVFNTTNTGPSPEI